MVITAVTLLLGLGPAVAAAEVEVVYIAPMTHTDIGFTAPPRTVAEQASRYADEALAFARRDADYVWNFEVFWQLDQWLHRPEQPGFPPTDAAATQPTARAPSPDDVRELLDLVRRGRFGIGAAYASPHTSLMSAWALDQLFRLPTQWAREHGLTLDWAVINDVPGHPPDLPQFLKANGLRYLALGVNQTLSKPLPAEVCNTPFWWEAPDGSRVLTWISAAAYIEAMTEYGLDPHTARMFNAKEFDQPETLQVMQHGIQRLREQYAASAYPYDAVLIFHAFDNWDPKPSSNLPAAVREWNATGAKPRLVLGTPGQFFQYIEAKYGSQLEVRRGGFGGQWELVRVGAPSAMARARAFEHRLLQSGEPVDPGLVRRLLSYWEHSYSLAPPWPKILTREEALEQNRQQWQMVADWPMPERIWPAGEPVSLPPVEGAEALQPNGLSLADSTFIAWHGFKPMPKEAWISGITERLADGTLRCRHRIDRRQLPPSRAQVIWSWKLSAADAEAPVIVKTATGTMRWPDEGLGDYSQFHWIAPRGFQIGSTFVEPHGPFAFARSREPAGWLLALVLGQGRAATFKNGEKAEMTFDEVYQGEEPVYEFAIDIRPGP